METDGGSVSWEDTPELKLRIIIQSLVSAVVPRMRKKGKDGVPASEEKGIFLYWEWVMVID